MLKGKTALITGSLGGIGLATAKALAGMGCDVMLNGFASADTIAARSEEWKADMVSPTLAANRAAAAASAT